MLGTLAGQAKESPGAVTGEASSDTDEPEPTTGGRYTRLPGTLAGQTKESPKAVAAEVPTGTDEPVPAVVEADDVSNDNTSPLRLTHSVQVGAFREQANASKRSDQLIKNGYLPRIVTVVGPDGYIWYTVRIGDYPSFEIARQQADRFTASENKPSAVRPYNAF